MVELYIWSYHSPQKTVTTLMFWGSKMLNVPPFGPTFVVIHDRTSIKQCRNPKIYVPKILD